MWGRRIGNGTPLGAVYSRPSLRRELISSLHYGVNKVPSPDPSRRPPSVPEIRILDGLILREHSPNPSLLARAVVEDLERKGIRAFVAGEHVVISATPSQRPEVDDALAVFGIDGSALRDESFEEQLARTSGVLQLPRAESRLERIRALLESGRN